MDYEKAYFEALDRAKTGKPIDEVFPELKESEDEMIRKHIIDIIKDNAKLKCIPCDAEIAYLEKQKEQSITANDLDEEVHRFFDDCIIVHEAKLYGNISERVISVDCYEIIARHFAKWGEKQKELKPAEWSGEDEKYLNLAINIVASDLGEDSPTVSWLKSLRLQPHWKPSEEQMKELLNALVPGKDFDCDILSELYGQLKTIK